MSNIINKAKWTVSLFVVTQIISLLCFSQPARSATSFSDGFVNSSSWVPTLGTWMTEDGQYKHKEAGKNDIKTSTTLFESDFSTSAPVVGSSVLNDIFTEPDGAATNWTPSVGTFGVVANEYKATTSSTETSSFLSDPNSQLWGDYKTKFRMKSMGTIGSTNRTFVYFRSTLTGGLDDGYVLYFYQDGVAKIYKRANGVQVAGSLDTVTGIAQTNDYHDVTITAIGSNINIWIDKAESEVPDLSITDSTHLTGTIGFGVKYADSYFDNVTVEPLTENSQWSIKRGYFYGAGNGEYKSVYDAQKNLSVIKNDAAVNWKDYRITTRLKRLGGIGTSSYAIVYIRSRMVDADDDNSYALKFRQNGTLEIERLDAGVATYLDSESNSIVGDNEWHDVIIRVSGETVKVWFDRTEAETPNLNYDGLTEYVDGSIGIGSSSASASFDYVKVENILDSSISPKYSYVGDSPSIVFTSNSSMNDLSISVTNPNGTTWNANLPVGCIGATVCQLAYPTDFPGANTNVVGPYILSATGSAGYIKNIFEVRERPITTFVQITDSHINPAEPDKLRKLQNFVSSINSSKNFPRPNFVATTGDNTNSGTLAEITDFKTAMDALVVPYYPVMAGHDSNSEVGAETGHNWDTVFGPNKFSYTWTVGDYLFVAIADVAEYSGMGGWAGSAEHQAWLQNILNTNPNKKIMLFYHRTMGNARDGGVAATYGNFSEMSALRTMFENHGGVISQFAGHAHINGVTEINGTHYMTTKSLYSDDNEYRYIEIYSDRIESHIVNISDIDTYDVSKWPGSTDSTHGNEDLYDFGNPTERNFKIDLASRTLLDAGGVSLTGASSWQDYDLSVSVTPYKERVVGENIAGIVFRYNDKNNYYRAIIDSSLNKVRVEKIVAGELKGVWTASVTINLDITYNLSVSARGGAISVSLNTVPVISITDTSLYSGKVGLYAYKAKTNFDNFLASNIELVNTGLSNTAARSLSKPISSITNLTSETVLRKGEAFMITGTSSNANSGIKKVEISFDNGITWSDILNVKQNSSYGLDFKYNWVPSVAGEYIIKTRSTDWLDVIETVQNSVTVKALSSTDSGGQSLTATGHVSVGETANNYSSVQDIELQKKSKLEEIRNSIKEVADKLSTIRPNNNSDNGKLIIQELNQKIKEIQEKILEVLKEESLNNNFIFSNTLRSESTGNEVSKLQEFLKKQGNSIYPEGLVSGYFGELTKKAVQRFQNKHSIVGNDNAGYGIFGPLTREKANELSR